MAENKVAACIITGDSYDEQEVKELLKSLEPHVHGVFINYNGTQNKLNWQKWTRLPVTYKKFKWEDNFGLARNQSFSLVPRDEFDYYLWIDTDDVLVVEEGHTLQEMFESLDEYTEGVFIRYAYAVEPETNIVVVEQWRERFLSTKIDWNWVFPIHEVCRAQGVQFAKRDQCYIEHQRKSGEDRGARDRNRKIISKALQENPEEPRYHFYAAGEALAEADTTTDPKKRKALIESSLEEYRLFREMTNELTDDVYLATNRIAELNRMKNDHSSALEADMECIAIYPDWPDGYVGAAKSCLELKDWPRMKAFADMATKCSKPQTAASIEPMMAGFTPLFLRGLANEELGNIDQALHDYMEARKKWNPPNGDLDKKIEYLEGLKLGKPKEERWTLRKKLRGTKPEKSICFFTQPIPEVWHPETLKTGGSGGAETCIMKLAPMFAADGWRTVVFGTPGHHRGVHEGVEYWNAEEFLPTEEFTVFVSSRSYVPFESNLKSKMKFLWMHDVNIGPKPEEIMLKPDRIFGLTNWHANHLQRLYKLPADKFKVVPNGIDLSRFPKEKWDNESSLRFVWSSSPDRGLDTLLSLWPMLKGRYPQAELHIFYGWEIIDKILQMETSRGTSNSYLSSLKNKCLYQINAMGGEKAGIYQHGRVDQDTLAEELMKSLVWSYPTMFMETFCITAIEMQAAGVIPVTSDLAALSENVAPVYKKIRGWPMNTSYQRDWLELAAQTVDNKDWRTEVREEAREFAEKFTWDHSYKIWNEAIKEHM